MDEIENSANMQFAMQAELQRKRVLIVDRHSQARDALRTMLASLGVTAVHGAGTSAEVLRQVKGNRFDIVLSDYILDDNRDGQQLLEELRHAQLIPLGTVYMIITSERGYHNVVSLAELAPDDYLIKPFTAEQLQIRLVKAIYKKHILRKIYTNLEQNSYQKALAACDEVASAYPQYQLDALRFKGDTLLALGNAAEAEGVYRQVLAQKPVPWAKMGLAASLREQKALDEAEQLAREVNTEAPEFLAVYDFLADIHEARGELEAAQESLQRAAEIAPLNSLRQRAVGDIAVRTKDLLTAEKAYNRVLERNRGSSLRSVDDYANLSRVFLERGQVENSRELIKSLRRDWRGNPHGELAALTLESLCLKEEGDTKNASKALEQALELQGEIDGDSPDSRVSERLRVDLAHACIASGKQDTGQQIMREVAAEHHDDQNLLSHIQGVFEHTGQGEAGRQLLDEVGARIVELNNRGVLSARSGDLQASVDMLIQAAEQIPNVQFLSNAVRAIFTLLDEKGWNEELAERGRAYLERAIQKDPRNPKVLAARETFANVARKYGIAGITKR